MKNGKTEVTPGNSKWTRTYNDTYNKKLKQDLLITQKKDMVLPKSERKNMAMT